MPKRCSKCGETKPVEDFHRWNQRDGRQVYCRSCRKAYDAEYHRRTWGDRRRAQKRLGQQRLAAWMRSLKTGCPCADCRQVFEPEVLQWDHLPGTEKVADVSDLVRAGASRARILEEIEKCDLVCANCHTRRTVTRRLGA